MENRLYVLQRRTVKKQSDHPTEAACVIEKEDVFATKQIKQMVDDQKN